MKWAMQSVLIVAVETRWRSHVECSILNFQARFAVYSLCLRWKSSTSIDMAGQPS